MFVGILKEISNKATWIETIEIRADDDELIDLTDVDEITLSLRSKQAMFSELELTLSEGQITIPTNGVIQWRAEVDDVTGLREKTYNAGIRIEIDTDTIQFFLGTVSIKEGL